MDGGLAFAENQFTTGRKRLAGVTSVSPVVHIVDDDAFFRTATGRLLRACGYAVETYNRQNSCCNACPMVRYPAAFSSISRCPA